MTEFLPAAEIPKTEEERKHVVRRIASEIGRTAVETKNELIHDQTNRRIAGGLALLGAVSTAAEVHGWLNNTDALLEFIQGSGRHFLVGYWGAMTGVVGSKAETMRGKIAAAVAGATGADFLTEAIQSLLMTGWVHHGSMHNIMSFLSHKEIFWGNAKDALAAELAVAPALAVE